MKLSLILNTLLLVLGISVGCIIGHCVVPCTHGAQDDIALLQQLAQEHAEYIYIDIESGDEDRVYGEIIYYGPSGNDPYHDEGVTLWRTNEHQQDGQITSYWLED